MEEFHIDEVHPKADAGPMIVHFQNGYATSNFPTKVCELLENADNSKKTVAVDINSIIYAGEECEEPLEKTLIMARDRKTGKVRIIEAGTVEVKPWIKSHINTDAAETSYVDLGRKFGSKRLKQMIDQREKLKVNEEVVTEQMKNVSHNVSQDQLDLSTYNKTDSDEFYVPPVNRETNNLEDVYVLTSILTPEQYKAIFSEINESDYKPHLFPYIQEILSTRWTEEQTVLACYASTLLTLNNTVMKEITCKKFVACPYSATLSKHILSNFFSISKGNRLRPPQYKDKALCHAIVFIFLINNYKIDFDTFIKQTKLSDKTATAKFFMTGAWITKQGSKKIAVLKLPLNKASANFVRRKTSL